MRDLLRELEATDTSSHPTWQPAVGDSLVGVVRLIDRVPSRFDDKAAHPHLLVATDDGELFHIYAHHVVLAQELDRLKPAVGDRVALKRLDDPPVGKSYKRYKVILDRAVPAEPDDIEFAFGANDGKVQA